MANAQQLADWWCRDDNGRLQVVQAPNTAILVAVGAFIAERLPFAEAQRTGLGYVGSGALIVWAIDELVRGSAPIRRVMGGAVLAWQVTRVFR